jgi:hypothetical protein
MAQSDTGTLIADWLKGQGYADEEITKILARLAARDQQILSDAVFDSIGNDGQTLDQMIREILRDGEPGR